jgi:aminoglycoside 6-adenylyltransferase
MPVQALVTPADRIVERAIAWAVDDPDIRRLVLVGSRARLINPDALADVDLQVYAVTTARYTEDERWLSAIGDPWVCVRDEYADGDVRVLTRLVIFDGGVKVDFAFYPAGSVSTGIRSGLAHRTLVEKEAAPAPSPSIPQIVRPSEAEFRRVVEEFWFEAWHIAKYLARDELWLAKARDWAAKEFLLTMIAWHEQFARGRAVDPDAVGKREAFETETWRALHASFAGFTRGESWQAAVVTMDLFRRLATETAAALDFTYPSDVDANLSALMASIAESAGL